jgi:hypothetical protein
MSNSTSLIPPRPDTTGKWRYQDELREEREQQILDELPAIAKERQALAKKQSELDHREAAALSNFNSLDTLNRERLKLKTGLANGEIIHADAQILANDQTLHAWCFPDRHPNEIFSGINGALYFANQRAAARELVAEFAKFKESQLAAIAQVEHDMIALAKQLGIESKLPAELRK